MKNALLVLPLIHVKCVLKKANIDLKIYLITVGAKMDTMKSIPI